MAYPASTSDDSVIYHIEHINTIISDQLIYWICIGCHYNILNL